MKLKIGLLFGLAAAAPLMAQTQTITIGTFMYLGTAASGSTVQSAYHIDLDASAVAPNPITFGNAIVIVKGTSESTRHGGFLTFSTGPGCGSPLYQVPCEFLFVGQAGYKLTTCARYNATKNTFTQNCIVVALQLMSTTGKNFSFPLLDGTTFCAYGINNIFVTAPPGYTALNPQCDINGFCVGVSAPIVLQAAPSCS
jgi:hypothetical protein